MTVTPVVFRELRSLSRQRFTYWLRACGVGALLGVSIVFSWDDRSLGNEGRQLFGAMHATLFWAIWLLLPLLCADCISREKREGTLGLLFLTRLRGPDVVMAKGISHGLRSLTLLLAVIPVLVIPSLMGGVTLTEALLSVLINLSALAGAISAALLASAWNHSRTRAMLAMILLEFLFLTGLGLGVGMAWMTVLTPTWVNGWESRLDYVAVSGLGFMTDFGGRWPELLRVVPPKLLLSGIGQVAVISMFCLVLAVLAAGNKTRKSWQDTSPSRGAIWFHRTFCTPVVWLSFFKRWMRRKLDRNPIGWLEQRTWSGRLVTWGWLAVIVSLYSVLMGDRGYARGYHDIQVVVGWLLIGSICFSASGSFRRERQSGVLELLLVSPLSEGAIIHGRLRGLWGQFLPSFVLLIAVWCYFARILPSAPEESDSIVFCAVSFMTLPIIGLYFSLRCRTLIMGFLVTVLTGVLIPTILPVAITFLWVLMIGDLGNNLNTPGTGATVLFQIIIATMCLGSLYSRLKNRSFTYEHTDN